MNICLKIEVEIKEQQKYNREVSLKDLIVKSTELFQELYRQKVYIAVAGVIFMLFFGGRAYLDKAEYSANLTFMIDEDSGNPLGSLGGVLGTFGIAQRGKNSLARLIQLSRSRNIIQNALFTQANLHGEKKLLANHLINYLDTLDQWNSQPWYRFYSSRDKSLDNFRFKQIDQNKFTATDYKAMKNLHGVIVGDPKKDQPGMLNGSYDEETRILELSVTSRNPELSIALTNQIFDELNDFYIVKMTEKQAVTYKIVKEKTDSIKNQLQLKESQLARKDDTSLGLYSQTTRLGSDRLRKDIALLTMALGESTKNMEIADFALRNTMPYVQTIDRPVQPLSPVKKSLLKNLVTGLFLGLFFSGLVILLRKLYLDANR